MSNDKISDVGINIAEKATVIWNVADMLRGPFKPHEYGLVILPMTVVKRFHDCLLPTHDNVLASDKIETDEGKIEKLRKFRTRAMTNRLASIWGTTEDLTGKLAISIMKAKAEIKRPGWQRAVDFDEASLRREIMELKNENEQLANDLRATKEELSSLTEQTDIAFENQAIKIEYHYYEDHRTRYGNQTTNLTEIFRVISTEMMDVSISEYSIEEAIKTNFLSGSYGKHFNDNQFVKKLLNQYRALNLMSSSWSNDNKKLYWGLTKKGRKVRDDLILIKNS